MKKFIVILASMAILAGCDESASKFHKKPNSAQCTGEQCNESPDGECTGEQCNEGPDGECAQGDCPSDLGKSCEFNRDCESKQCVNHRCRFESKASVNSNNSTSGGSSGGSGSSGSGGSGSSGSGGSSPSGVSGASDLWVAGGSTPSGQSCTQNQECESGLCYQGLCSDDCELVGCTESNLVCRYNRCIPITTDGGECSFEVEYYLSSSHDGDMIKDLTIVGCQSHQFCCNGFCMDDKCEPRISCKISEHCKSGTCYDYIDDIVKERTVCGCSHDKECGSEMYCDEHTEGFYVQRVHSDYYLTSMLGLDTCQGKLKVGAKCDRDAMCKLGACYDGECVIPKNAESRCDSDGDCATQTCGESNYEEGDLNKWEACHKDGVKCTIDAFCEDKYNDGERCYQDANCKSGYCSEKTGTCKPLT